MASLFHTSASAGLILNLGLGITVFMMNPRRRANRFFFGQALTLCLWYAILSADVFVSSVPVHRVLVRLAHSVAFFILASVDLLRSSIVDPSRTGREIFKQSRPFFLLAVLGSLIAHSPGFVAGLTVAEDGFVKPSFGPMVILYLLAWGAALGMLVRRFALNLRTATGIVRTELQFIVLAAAVAGVLAHTFSTILPLATGNANFIQLMPLTALMSVAVLAYGIATQRIMSVSYVLRQASAYALLAVALVACYGLAFLMAKALFSPVTSRAGVAGHLVGTLAVAFAMVPAHGWALTAARRLFISLYPLDLRRTLEEAHQTLLSIRTLDALLERLAVLAQQHTTAETVRVLLREGHRFAQAHPPDPAGAIVFTEDSPLIRYLSQEGHPVSLETLGHLPSTPIREATEKQLCQTRTSLAVAIHAMGQLKGILLLGRRLSGRIYGVEEQAALQFLCDQIGIAIENARLYTDLQNAKIYHETLVDSLTCGVVATGADGTVTVCNREARRILGIPQGGTDPARAEMLPPPLGSLVSDILRRQTAVWTPQVHLRQPHGIEIPVSVSGTPFRAHTGDPAGALLVLSDLTLVRRLEHQVRRADRLASMGTLAAGVAHEIKNPLVSIKTFAQLLPERYQDHEFRHTFSTLIVQEVGRIDALVTHLLRFARPPEPRKAPLRMHRVLGETLGLLDHQLRRAGVRVVCDLAAPEDAIRGDADLLSHAFLNLFLNAMEAMQQGGTLTVRTRNDSAEALAIGRAAVQDGPCLRISIVDTGHGIRSEDLPRIFDPFFTTKPGGTGLGLSVTHSILQEHGAMIEVDSTPGRGTEFSVTFPLHQELQKDALHDRNPLL